MTRTDGTVEQIGPILVEWVSESSQPPPPPPLRLTPASHYFIRSFIQLPDLAEFSAQFS